MSADCFQTVDVTRLRRALANLHHVVGCGKGRVEVTRKGCEHVCVLISKTELESLEHALQIFADSHAFKQMSEQISQIVATAGPTISQPTIKN
jgi:hypothetical protein